MACYYPWSFKDGGLDRRLFACGQCHGCRLERSRQWGVRCMHEASLYDRNCFLTLTYRDARFSLEYSDFQRFMKRLRARFRARIRFYMCGEYGEINSRPHFHACLFNFDFDDKVYLSRTDSGCKLYRSAALESLWTAGFSSVGAVTFESAAYVARYCMKKLGGSEALGIVDPDSGEVFFRAKEFAHMSLRPGIGAEWFRRFKRDVYPHGKVVVNGHECRPPRYYDKLFRQQDAGGWMELAHSRATSVNAAFSEQLPKRLEDREAVSKAGLRKGKL